MAGEVPPDEVRTTALVLVVRVRDPAGDPLPRDVGVSIAGTSGAPVRTPDGEFRLLRGDARPPVPSGQLTVRVDGGDRYRDVERTVTPTDESRLFTVELTPYTA